MFQEVEDKDESALESVDFNFQIRKKGELTETGIENRGEIFCTRGPLLSSTLDKEARRPSANTCRTQDKLKEEEYDILCPRSQDLCDEENDDF